MTTPDMSAPMARAEARLEDHDRRLDRLERQADKLLEQGTRLLGIAENVEKAVDTQADAMTKHLERSAEGRETHATRMAKVEAEGAENRRNISRLWKWGSGLGAGITAAAAALARWWS